MKYVRGFALRFCIFDKFPGHADAAGPRTTFESYCRRGWEFSPILKGGNGEKMNWGDDHFLGTRDMQALLVQSGMVCCDKMELYRIEMVSTQHPGSLTFFLFPASCDRYQGRCPRMRPG